MQKWFAWIANTTKRCAVSILGCMQIFRVWAFNVFRRPKNWFQSVRTLKEHWLELKKCALGNANAYQAQRSPLARSTFLFLPHAHPDRPTWAIGTGSVRHGSMRRPGRLLVRRVRECAILLMQAAAHGAQVLWFASNGRKNRNFNQHTTSDKSEFKRQYRT